jgi:ATP-dependent RNA helicase DDX19/DBP5
MKTIPKANYIFVEKEQLSLDVIRQYQIVCPDARSKIDVLKDRIFPAAEKLGQSIIFVRTRGSASELHKRLEADGHKCTSIQGGLSHEERDRVIKEFRAGETKILIATDVLARGFDQAQVNPLALNKICSSFLFVLLLQQGSLHQVLTIRLYACAIFGP